NEWLSNNQIERIVLRPEGQASRSGTRITRAATSRDSRSGKMVQRLGAQVDGRRVTSRVNLEQQIIADLKAKLRNAEQYVEMFEHKYEVLQERMPPPFYEAAHTDVQASVRIYLRMTRRAIMQNREVASKKSRQQTNRSALDDSSSCESAASSMTSPEDWTEVSSQTSSLSERSVMADRNIAYCEGLVVGFLDSLHTTQSETRSLPSKDSPGRVLLRDACKLLVKEHTGYTGTVVETHSKDNEIPHMEEDHEVGHPLDFVIDTMSPEITDRDIATLIFHWTTLDKFQSFKRVQAFEICLQRQELVLNLLGMVFYVASPCELPTYPFYKVRKSLEEMEREKLKYGCEQLAYAVRMRREMQVKLQNIASIDPDYKDIDMVEIWEKIPDAGEWLSPQTTMGNTTPAEDWSYLLQRDDTASGPMDCSFLRIPRAHPTKLVKRQQRKDTGDPTLEEMLDNFGDGNKLGASYPIGALVTVRKYELIKKYRQTCYDRLYNSVIGSAQACSRISGELLETSMQRQTTCMQPALGLLQNEFHDMHYALRDLRFIVGTRVWHDNATITVRCVQRVCHQVVIQLRGIISDNQIWKVIAPDHINDKLHALVITLQEQQMVLELLILVMAFFDAGIVVPSVIHQHRIYHHESKRLDNFLDGILEGVRAKRAMRQDILKLRSSSQQHEDKFSTRSSDELPAADTWSSSQSTLTLGAMTPIGDWSNVNCDMAMSEDRALEHLLETINMKLREEDVARLVFHWTNVKEFGRLSRHNLKEGCS
ncbi:hypothetical protein KCU89_g5353, partial [Aureobasidium melanogenum]